MSSYSIGTAIQLQELLLDRDSHDLKPDDRFLKLFAEVVGSKWPSLALILSLPSSKIMDVKREGESLPNNCAFLMLQEWAAKKDATFGQLYQKLRANSLFQHS